MIEKVLAHLRRYRSTRSTNVAGCSSGSEALEFGADGADGVAAAPTALPIRQSLKDPSAIKFRMSACCEAERLGAIKAINELVDVMGKPQTLLSRSAWW